MTPGLGASSAQAAPVFHCEASPLRGSVLGQAPIEPVVHGRSGDCTTADATSTVQLPALLKAQRLIASTLFDATGAKGEATGGVAQLRVLPTPDLITQLPTTQYI